MDTIINELTFSVAFIGIMLNAFTICVIAFFSDSFRDFINFLFDVYLNIYSLSTWCIWPINMLTTICVIYHLI